MPEPHAANAALMSGARSGGSNPNSNEPAAATASTKKPSSQLHLHPPGGTETPPPGLNVSNKPTKVIPNTKPPVPAGPSLPPAASLPQPTVRPPSLRPVEPPSAKQLTSSEFNALCRKVVQQVHLTSLRRMFDDVKLADKRGNVSDQEYSHLLDFFYCFVPMCVRAPENDPVIARPFELRNYERIMGELWEERAKTKGPHKEHRWYSRPTNKWMRTTKAIMKTFAEDLDDIVPALGRKKSTRDRGKYLDRNEDK